MTHDGSIPFQIIFSPIRVVCQNTLSAALGLSAHQRNRQKSLSIRHTKNAEALIQQLPELVDVKRRCFLGGLEELRHMASRPCNALQFRHYVSTLFADQLQGNVNDVRGDSRTARPKVLEDLPAWPALLEKFEGRAIGSDLLRGSTSAWSAYQSVTEYLSHEAGRSKNPVEAARKRFESLYWGKSAELLSSAHEIALTL